MGLEIEGDIGQAKAMEESKRKPQGKPRKADSELHSRIIELRAKGLSLRQVSENLPKDQRISYVTIGKELQRHQEAQCSCR